MSKIILTSDGIDSKEIYDYFDNIVNKDVKIGIITTAKDEKENAKGPQRHKKLFIKMSAQIIDFIDLEVENPNIILNYDIIFLEGGNPFRLMYWIRKSKSEPIFKQFLANEGVLVGRSAGSLVLGQDFSICNYLSPEMNNFDMTDFSGLGLCDVNICPHYNVFPDVYEDCEKKLKKCEKEQNIKINKLYDGQAFIVFDKTVGKIVGEVDLELTK